MHVIQQESVGATQRSASVFLSNKQVVEHVPPETVDAALETERHFIRRPTTRSLQLL